ncbi:MAG TPA: NADH-quinone oxidoreductase subunit B [Candidatus Marinimicrobia bacterium]|nr:NADH-quinone oxidoreductase subunit B [Candidatus Neomarinimicrobiota bacterium]
MSEAQRIITPRGHQDGIILAKLDEVLSLARSHSQWYLQFGLACCAIEMMATAASRYDLDRFGAMPRATPRQADLIFVSGTVTLKMAEKIKVLWEQMPAPKYAIAMGSCAISGGPYSRHGYSVLKGVDLIIPVDVYVPGCPPRPEALLEGLVLLAEKVKKEKLLSQKFSKKRGGAEK